MAHRLALVLLGLGALGCGGARSTATAVTRPAPPASHGGAAPWVRLTAQSTSLCLRLPDGSFHHVKYGVGGGGPFRLYPPVPVPATRDLLCSSYGVYALGARGIISYLGDDGRLAPSQVVPTARTLAIYPGGTCTLDEAGALACEGSAHPPFDLNAAGPIADLLGARCARYRDGRVLCQDSYSASGAVTWWTNARQASFVDHQGCAIVSGGEVSCVGDNRVGQRGFVGATDAKPTEVPGLDGFDEVAVGDGHACARKGGEVWCWGRADDGQAGAAALARGKKWPRCQVDEVATARAAADLAAAQATCRGPRPPGDDPFCRSVSGAYAGTIYRGNPWFDCDPSGDIRMAPPTRVEGIDDAVAIGVRGSMSCAVRGAHTLTCWGGGSPEPRSIEVPSTAPAPEPVATPLPARLDLDVSDVGVMVRGEGVLTYHPWYESPLGGGAPVTDALDAAMAPLPCRLTADGTISCVAMFDNAARTVSLGAGFVRLIGDGTCALTAEGALRCEQDSGRWSARASMLGDVVDASNHCVLFADGALRCNDARGPLSEVATGVRALAGGFYPMSTCVVRTDGSVACAGAVLGGAADRLAPITGLPPATAIAASTAHACAIVEGGEVWCWGETTAGEGGRAAYDGAQVTPVCPIDRAATTERRRALRSSEPACRKATPPEECLPTEYTWVEGCEPPGRWGTTRRHPAPIAVPGVTDAIAIDVALHRTCVLTAAGQLRCWGDGSPEPQTVPTRLR